MKQDKIQSGDFDGLIAESEQQAEKEAGLGYWRWYNDYVVGSLTTDGQGRVEDPGLLLEQTKEGVPGLGRTIVIGTPAEAVAAIRGIYKATGGFGCVLGLAHDWANVESTWRSWELFARYVIPEVNGLAERLKASFAETVQERATLMAQQFAAIQKAKDAR